MSWWPTAPCPAPRSRANGCFPRAALDRWLAAGLVMPALAHAPAPPIVGGSHDPLLEWALRESGSGLASLPEGSEAGLRRLARGEVMAAAIHLHRLDGDDEAANVDAVAARTGPARRRRDRLRAPRAGPRGGAGQSACSCATSPASPRGGRAWRCGRRAPARSCSCSPFSPAPAWRSMRWHWSSRPARPAPISPRRCAPAAPIAASRPASVAQAAGLDFVPLTWERFDLALRQRDYFRPGRRRCSSSSAQQRSATAPPSSPAMT